MSLQPTSSTRRRFLSSGLKAGLASGLGLAVCANADAASHASVRDDLFDISLAQWSLNRAVRGKQLDPFVFPKYAKDTFGIEAVEYVSTFYPGQATNFEALARLKQNADDAGVRSLLIMIDAEGSLADSDDTQRAIAVERHFKWISAAKFLGCHAIRVNAHGDAPWEARRDLAADSLHRLGRVGDEFGIDVIVENHGGLSSNGKWLAEVMVAADHPRVGTLPDFGNFRIAGGEDYDRYQGVTELMPFARAVSAKSHDFDDAGNETHTDYERMLKIVLDAGYRGHVGIEFEGGADEVEGIRLTQRLLERVRETLRPQYV
mgnify:CR=1 FL=1|tara:strand:+ start:34692 stop:35645 length:954 start_codon:yes stop_codon:yes gene_type:complete